MSDLPFTVIGGYLGAGKTTLLNRLLTEARGRRIAVLVNDFGSVNIDATLVAGHEGGTINLANGCMCCSLVDGFAQAIGEIRARADSLDHVVIEASGVADPARIARYGQMYDLPLDGILVVADAERVRTQAEDKYVGDTVIRQFGQADLIVVNKTDLVSAAQVAKIQEWLGSLAPGVPIVMTRMAEVPLEVLLGAHDERGPAAAGSTPEATSSQHAHAVHATWTLERAEPVGRDAIARFAAGLGPDIYRAKGFVHLAEDPGRRYIFQQVGPRWSLEPDRDWTPDSPRTVLVVIGRPDATNVASLERLLAGVPPVRH